MGCPFLLQGIFPHPGIEPEYPASPSLHADCLLAEPSGRPRSRGSPQCFHSVEASTIANPDYTVSLEGLSQRPWCWREGSTVGLEDLHGWPHPLNGGRGSVGALSTPTWPFLSLPVQLPVTRACVNGLRAFCLVWLVRGRLHVPWISYCC